MSKRIKKIKANIQTLFSQRLFLPFYDIQYNSIKEDLAEIKTNVKETNGRVRKLEVKYGVLMGIGIVLSIVIVPIVLILAEKSF